MKRLSYKSYFNKVFGCWMGKSISGTIGAPFEGRKELFDFTYDPKSIENLLPNDDLDLQVLWLEVMEKKGIYFKTEDLADAFLNQCPYAPGEYAVFKKNYKRGIRPPVSGVFNNSYYLNGMGCPIRSEIWACISPGNPALAKKFSWMDGIMDHGEDSVQGEVFFAVMEAEAFFEEDIIKLIDIALSWIPQNNKVACMIRDVIKWYNKGYDWKYTRSLILNNYGHPDCTNLYQNMGFTILALLYGKGDFLDTTMLALNCGYDTDCTCATVGAILGIIYGADFLIDKYGFTDTGYILGVDAQRRSNLIKDLAEDTCRVGLTVANEMNKEVMIYDSPEFTPVPTDKPKNKYEIIVDYHDIPSIGIGESRRISVNIKNNTDKAVDGIVELKLPEFWSATLESFKLKLAPHSEECIPVVISVDERIEKINHTNIISIVYNTGKNEMVKYDFGMAGAIAWKLYGPFWENNLTLPPMDYWDSYYKYIIGRDENETADLSRIYHLNSVVDIHKEYISEPDLMIDKKDAHQNPSLVGEFVNTHTDRFSVNDIVKLEGPCVVYLETNLYSPYEKDIGILIGNTDAFKLWVNDSLISNSNDTDWCTNENRHIMNFHIKKGVNRIVFKLIRRSSKADYSLIFCEIGKLYSNHITDFSSMNPLISE